MDRAVIVIAGPTASGKTTLGIQLAQQTDGEIISADSRQIYRHMDIGTAKPTSAERSEVPHHLIDIVDPDTPYSADTFAHDASGLIEDVARRGHQPIVVGGAGFYLEALFDGLSPVPSTPDEIRKEVGERVQSDPKGAYRELQRIDPETASSLTGSDRQRISRALEVHASTGYPISHFQAQPRVPATLRKAVRFGLSWDRGRLYDRINQRVITMVEEGLVEETQSLFELGYDRETYALKTFGYREIGAHIEDEMTLEDAIVEIQVRTRHYAKRQLTWFRNRSSLKWLGADAPDNVDVILTSATNA